MDLKSEKGKMDEPKTQCHYCEDYVSIVVRVNEFIACPACARKIFEKQKVSK